MFGACTAQLTPENDDFTDSEPLWREIDLPVMLGQCPRVFRLANAGDREVRMIRSGFPLKSTGCA